MTNNTFKLTKAEEPTSVIKHYFHYYVSFLDIHCLSERTVTSVSVLRVCVCLRDSLPPLFISFPACSGTTLFHVFIQVDDFATAKNFLPALITVCSYFI